MTAPKNKPPSTPGWPSCASQRILSRSANRLPDRRRLAKRAEAGVKWRLRLLLNPFAYRSFHDVLLRKTDGGTTEIDHIVISRYGIVVIETKTWNDCAIFGEAERAKWSLNYKSGNRKSRPNPLRQNRGHILALADLLNLPPSAFRNLVWMTGNAELRNGPIPGVLQAGLIRSITAMKQPVLTRKEVRTSVARIQSASVGHLPEERLAHIQHVGELKRARRNGGRTARGKTNA